MSKNQKPFQVAIGGGEPTSHPKFIKTLKVFKKLGIEPNYTTNGMFVNQRNFSKILDKTKKYCGGVAVSCHPHLEKYWKQAANLFSDWAVKLNFHIIISGKESIDYFRNIYDEWKGKVDYFVLLPHSDQGRSYKREIEWEYLIQRLPINQKQIAFGANFYPYLKGNKHNIDVSLYEPEIMSKFLDLKDMKLYPSSFNLNPIN